MSFFSATLELLRQERDWSQKELEKRTGVAQSNLSRYLNGVLPDGEVLERICNAFGEDDATLLVIAWLKDLVPISLRHLVDVEPREAGAASSVDPATDWLKVHSPRVQKLVQEVAANSEGNPAVFAAFQSTLALLGKKPSSG